MSISLSPNLEHLIQERLQTGLYADGNAILQAALELLRQRDESLPVPSDEFVQMVAVGEQQLDRGEFVDGEVVFARLRAKSAARP